MTDRYKEIRDALAKGPTPGEWYWSDAYPTQDGRETWSLIGDGGFGILSCDGEENSPQSVNVAAAELIAACDPDTIRELLTERDQLADALEAAREDEARLAWLAADGCIEGFVGVEYDIYDYACGVAEESGREEPNESDMLGGLRRLIDAAQAALPDHDKEGGNG